MTRGDARDERIRETVCGVIVQAVHDAGAGGIVVLDDWTPEGELAYEWLIDALGEQRVWRGASAASNVQGALVAHPASKTTLVLGGALPRADLFPLGDLYASQVRELAGDWSAPAWLAALADRCGGIAALDAVLMRLVDRREPARTAVDVLDADAAAELLRLYERGRWFRLNARLVPRLTTRTLGIDLFD